MIRVLGFAALALSAVVPAVVSLVFVALGVGFVLGIAYALNEVGKERRP